MFTNQAHTVTESDVQRLRRRAAKCGFRLAKRNDRFGNDGFMIIDSSRNYIVAGSDPYEYSFSFQDVEQYLNEMD